MHGFVFKNVRSVTEPLTFREVSYAPFQGASNLQYKYIFRKRFSAAEYNQNCFMLQRSFMSLLDVYKYCIAVNS